MLAILSTFRMIMGIFLSCATYSHSMHSFVINGQDEEYMESTVDSVMPTGVLGGCIVFGALALKLIGDKRNKWNWFIRNLSSRAIFWGTRTVRFGLFDVSICRRGRCFVDRLQAWTSDVSDSTSSRFCRTRKTRPRREKRCRRSTSNASSQQQTPKRTTATTAATGASQNPLSSTLGTGHISRRYADFSKMQTWIHA